MTPVGHAAVSYLVSRALGARGSTHGCLLGGLLPDFDFVLLPFSFFNGLHRVVTHNVFFVGIGALLAGACVSKNRLTLIACALLCGTIHLFVDSIMDTNPTNGIGVAMFWPLWDGMISPFNLFTPDPEAEGWGNFQQSLIKALPIVLMEVPLWAIAGTMAYRQHRTNAAPDTSNPTGET